MSSAAGVGAPLRRPSRAPRRAPAMFPPWGVLPAWGPRYFLIPPGGKRGTPEPGAGGVWGLMAGERGGAAVVIFPLRSAPHPLSRKPPLSGGFGGLGPFCPKNLGSPMPPSGFQPPVIGGGGGGRGKKRAPGRGLGELGKFGGAPGGGGNLCWEKMKGGGVVENHVRGSLDGGLDRRPPGGSAAPIFGAPKISPLDCVTSGEKGF